MDLLAAYRKTILANELDGDLKHVLDFSDPDGVRSKKSGWSFGLCQFDLSNNPIAALALRECGLTQDEITSLKDQTAPPAEVKRLAGKLKEAVVAKYDNLQLKSCLKRAQLIPAKYGAMPADDTAILAVADYDNQYYLSDSRAAGTLVGYLADLKMPFTADDVLDFKLNHTKYGKEHPKDCQRRYDNLMRVAGPRA